MEICKNNKIIESWLSQKFLVSSLPMARKNGRSNSECRKAVGGIRKKKEFLAHVATSDVLRKDR